MNELDEREKLLNELKGVRTIKPFDYEKMPIEDLRFFVSLVCSMRKRGSQAKHQNENI